MTYGADGRPTSAALDATQLSDGCRSAAVALVNLTIVAADEPVSAGDQQWIVLPTAREFVTCVDAPRPDKDAAESVESSQEPAAVRAPRKIRDVKPTYPTDALERRVDGTVIISSVIAREGCISSARVIRTVDPWLDAEALRTMVLYHCGWDKGFERKVERWLDHGGIGVVTR